MFKIDAGIYSTLPVVAAAPAPIPDDDDDELYSDFDDSEVRLN